MATRRGTGASAASLQDQLFLSQREAAPAMHPVALEGLQSWQGLKPSTRLL